jgi:tRNA A37 methylthiotransferase MiaB
MIDGADSETGQRIGRTEGHAPEVDGLVYIDEGDFAGREPPQAGDMLMVKITGATDYDLIGKTFNG